MNKTDLVDAIAKEAGLTKSDAGNALNAVVAAVMNALQNGDSVNLTGFGTFGTVLRPERTGRNPRTGESMTIKAARVPKFKPGKALKDAVDGEGVAA